jgi:hypothetical protein
MLSRICHYLYNRFETETRTGTWTVSDGTISADLKEGQRFWILGSDLNDGLYTYHATGVMDDDDLLPAQLLDETFDGAILPAAVPRDLLDLAGEIRDWVSSYGDRVDSPFQSENVIGVYSYSKGANGSGASGSSGVTTWQSTFATRLAPWKRTGWL